MTTFEYSIQTAATVPQELLATAEVLSDPEFVEQIRQGEREIEAGEGIALEELEALIAQDIERGDS